MEHLLALPHWQAGKPVAPFGFSDCRISGSTSQQGREGNMTSSNRVFWPFDVPPEPERSNLENAKIKFLTSVSASGFRAFRSGTDNFGAESDTRTGEIVWRGRTFCEVQLMHEYKPSLRAYLRVTDFNRAADAIGEWLEGASEDEIVSRLQPYLYVPRGADYSFVIESK